MPKNVTDETIPLLTAEVARILDQRATRVFDGYILIDSHTAKGAISGRILAAHDDSPIASFSLALAV